MTSIKPALPGISRVSVERKPSASKRNCGMTRTMFRSSKYLGEKSLELPSEKLPPCTYTITGCFAASFTCALNENHTTHECDGCNWLTSANKQNKCTQPVWCKCQGSSNLRCHPSCDRLLTFWRVFRMLDSSVHSSQHFVYLATLESAPVPIPKCIISLSMVWCVASSTSLNLPWNVDFHWATRRIWYLKIDKSEFSSILSPPPNPEAHPNRSNWRPRFVAAQNNFYDPLYFYDDGTKDEPNDVLRHSVHFQSNSFRWQWQRWKLHRRNCLQTFLHEMYGTRTERQMIRSPFRSRLKRLAWDRNEIDPETRISYADTLKISNKNNH